MINSINRLKSIAFNIKDYLGLPNDDDGLTCTCRQFSKDLILWGVGTDNKIR